MGSMFSFLRTLWPFRRRQAAHAGFQDPALPPGDRGEDPQPASHPSLSPSLDTVSSPLGLEVPSALDPGSDDDDEVFGTEEEDEEEDGVNVSAPDPFVTSQGSDEPTILSVEEIAHARQDARAKASTGEHKIYLTDPAGPGSLAEALSLLLEEGQVAADFHDDGLDEPYILYRPKV